jgi:hypothetical protein
MASERVREICKQLRAQVSQLGVEAADGTKICAVLERRVEAARKQLDFITGDQHQHFTEIINVLNSVLVIFISCGCEDALALQKEKSTHESEITSAEDTLQQVTLP